MIFKQFFENSKEGKKEEFKLKLIEPGESMVAEWELNGRTYKLYHNSTGSLRFLEKVSDFEEEEQTNEFFKREIKLLKSLKNMIHGEKEKSLWGGRPDILLEIYENGNDSENSNFIFIGEVKYTDNRSYAIQGLRELLEYIALIKEEKESSDKRNIQDQKKTDDESSDSENSTPDYDYCIQNVESLFSKMKNIKGGLFVGKIKDLNIDTDKESDNNINVYQFPADDKKIVVE